METPPTVHLRLDVARRGGTLTGRVGVDDGPARPFTGWIGLNAAVERLLLEQEPGEEPAPQAG